LRSSLRIISKGHASPVVYATLADCGYFPKEELTTFRKLGARLQGHVHRKVPGVELSTGSLGHGLSVANGMALAARMQKKDFKVYCILGDGEIQEGSVWEAAMSSAHFGLHNVCAIVDYNKIQENGHVRDIMNLEPLAEKWKSFGWEVAEIDGHDFKELARAFDEFDKAKKPYVIIANTAKGKGISFMEGKSKWHGKAPNHDELKSAIQELEDKKEKA
jgi:transketolase